MADPVMEKNDILGGSAFVAPGGPLRGEITVPGDKSISHRAVFFGSIAEGVTEVEGFLEGEDNLSTIRAFRAMGVGIEQPAAGKVAVRGVGKDGLKEPEDIIDAGNSGTTARLLAGLLSAQPFFSVLTGDPTLRRRPMKRVVEPLRMMGAVISGRNGGSLLPLAITGGSLRGITYRTPVASAQLKSALILAGLYAKGETIVEEPEKSRDHTERMLRHFGAPISTVGNKVMVRKGGLKGTRVSVPGDISSAAFFMVGANIVPGSEVLIKGVGVNPTRTGIIKILKKMNGHVETVNSREVSGEPVADILVKGSALRGVEIGPSELLPAIDEFPAVCVAAAFAEGRTIISGASELRVKESDRIAVMAECLRVLDIKVEEKPDGIIIEGVGGLARGGSITSHGDHRIAMAMAIASLRTEKGVEIKGSSCMDVSFPGFIGVLEGVRR